MFKNIAIENRDSSFRNEIRFDLLNTHNSFANALRRIILSDIPSVGFREGELHSGENSSITIHENVSCLHNEFLKHRLSLIPIYIQPEEFKKNKYEFHLNIENDKHSERLDVTTEMIKGRVRKEDGDVADLTESQLRKLFPANPISGDYILITSLRDRTPNEKLSIELHPVVGNAKEHAGFGVVSKCTYYNLLDDEKVNAARSEIAAQENEENRDEMRILLRDFENHGKYKYYHVDSQSGEADRFHFEVESIGVIDPSKIVSMSIELLIEKLNNLLNGIDDINKFEFSIPKLENMYCVDIRLKGYCHTIGNLLQSYIYEQCVPTKQILYIGYNKPHPLDDAVVLRIALNKGENNYESYEFDEYFRDVRDLVLTQVSEMVREITQFKTRWNGVVVAANAVETDTDVPVVVKEVAPKKKIVIKK